MLCYVTLRYVTLRYVTLCYVTLCYVTLCYVMLYYVMLCYVMLCYVMLCYLIVCVDAQNGALVQLGTHQQHLKEFLKRDKQRQCRHHNALAQARHLGEGGCHVM
jgi:hypothetical protein